MTSVSEKEIVYLACPYTHDDPTIREERFHLATKVAARLIREGLIVYSPITMTHPIDLELGGPATLGSEYWVAFDEAFMNTCSRLFVLTLEGWKTSSGVAREIEHFKRQGKPIEYVSIG